MLSIGDNLNFIPINKVALFPKNAGRKNLIYISILIRTSAILYVCVTKYIKLK